MQRLSFQQSIKAFILSVSHYSKILRKTYKLMGILFFFFYWPYFLKGILPIVEDITGLSAMVTLIDLSLWLVGSLLWLLTTYFFVEFLVNEHLGADTNPDKLIRSLSLRGMWDYLLTVSFAHIAIVVCALVLLIISFSFIAVMIFFFGKASYGVGIGITLILLFIGALELIIATSVGFTAHQYYFQRQVSFQPVRASVEFFKLRWLVIIYASLFVCAVSLLINLASFLPGIIERLVIGGMILGPDNLEWFNTLRTFFEKLVNKGPFDISTLSLLLPFFQASLNTSMTQTIVSALSSFITVTFWCHHFLYFVGFYHQKDWQYPNLFVQND